jgi:hypothetical protein
MDDSFFLYEEMLAIEIGREPTVEEVYEYIEKRLIITKQEEIEYENRKIYGSN